MTWFFALLRPLIPATSTLVIWGLVTVGIGAAFTWWSVRQYNKGYNTAIEDIALENKEAVDAAKKARKPVEDCSDAGGSWDVIGRVCIRP